MLTEHETIKPHCDAMRPYGYRFEGIDLIKLTDFTEALALLHSFDHETYRTHTIQLGNNFPHVDRVIWHVASHIEGNFGLPYDATLVYSEAHGTLYVFTRKQHDWWKHEIWQHLSNYLMGLRSLLDLLKDG